MQEELFGHAYAFSSIIILTAFIIFAGMVGRYIANKKNISPVLGEICIGIIIGNVGYWLGGDIFFLIMHMTHMSQIVTEVWNAGLSIWDATRVVFHQKELIPDSIPAHIDAVMSGEGGAVHVVTAVTLWVFSNLGVHFLIFMVGVHISIAQIRSLGHEPLIVAITGIAVPFALGVLTIMLLIPASSLATQLFVGAALSATSIGLTARIFHDMGKLNTREARIIIGAAVIDDVLVLIMLAMIIGIIKNEGINTGEIIRIGILSIAFLGTILIFGEKIAELGIRVFGSLDPTSFKLLYPIFLLCGIAWLAEHIGLAAIVGAFAAGVILNDCSFRKYSVTGPKLETVLKPMETVFSPVFFVTMGMQVDLHLLLSPSVLWFIVVLLVVSVFGKIVAGCAVFGKADRLSIGIGMVPRGEVGLIIAGAGKSLGVASPELFSAIVITTILTTVVASFGLEWSLQKK